MQKTMENLSKAFIGESMARNRYTIYSKIAEKEGYPQLSNLFLLTADNEREHAKWLMNMIQDLKKKGAKSDVNVEAGVPNDVGDTSENLKAAIAGENYEHATMYPEFSKVAEEEGLSEISKRLSAIGQAEVHHEERYQKLLVEVEAGTMFKKSEEKEWVCGKCGYTHKGKEAPGVCPSCSHPTKYFEVKCEEY